MSDVIEKAVSGLTEKIDKKFTPVEKSVADLTATVAKHSKILEKPAVSGENFFAVIPDAERIKHEKKCGWKDIGDQLRSVHRAKKGMASREELERLHKTTEFIYGTVEKAATGLGESIGPDGGFLLAPQFVEGVLEITHKQAEDLFGRCDNYEMTSPRMILKAVDETSRATGSRRGGVRGYWVDEGGTGTPSKPKFRNIELVPHKLFVLTYASDELLADGGPMVGQYLSRYAAEEINFLASNAIVNGTGAGQPLGILNAACTVSVSKEVGQGAATVITENIVRMWARLHAGSRNDAVWLINQDVGPQLPLMTVGTAGSQLAVYMPPGGLSSAPYGTLYGKPIIEIEYCQTLGTVGDIILCDLKSYIAAKRGAIDAASSIHVQFLTDETAFRWTWRLDGQPWWNSALTPFAGSNTQSPFVTLATRA